jgi:hypothetical protein
MEINRKNVPKKIKEISIEKGKIIVQHDSPVCILWWCDKRNVITISCYHGAEDKGKQTHVCAIHYNQYRDGVNTKDQMLQST